MALISWKSVLFTIEISSSPKRFHNNKVNVVSQPTGTLSVNYEFPKKKIKKTLLSLCYYRKIKLLTYNTMLLSFMSHRNKHENKDIKLKIKKFKFRNQIETIFSFEYINLNDDFNKQTKSIIINSIIIILM